MDPDFISYFRLLEFHQYRVSPARARPRGIARRRPSRPLRARIGSSIFIASSSTTMSPFLTASPGLTLTLITVAGIGAVSDPPARSLRRVRAFAVGWVSRRASACRSRGRKTTLPLPVELQGSVGALVSLRSRLGDRDRRGFSGQPRAFAIEKRGVDPAVRGTRASSRMRIRNGTFVRTPSMSKRAQRRGQTIDRQRTCLGGRDHFGEHRIVVDRDLAALGDAGIDADARSMCGSR